jgi:hypothetical protein
MCPNCPQLKGNVHATAVRHDVTLPMAGDPSSGPPPMEGEQGESEVDLKDHPMIEEPAVGAADIWDDQEDAPNSEPTLVYHSSTIRIPLRSGIMTKHMHAACFLEQALPPNRRKAGQLDIAAVSVDFPHQCHIRNG